MEQNNTYYLSSIHDVNRVMIKRGFKMICKGHGMTFDHLTCDNAKQNRHNVIFYNRKNQMCLVKVGTYLIDNDIVPHGYCVTIHP